VEHTFRAAPAHPRRPKSPSVTAIDHNLEDQIRVNGVPKKLKDGDNNALTTPVTVTGTAEELDAELGPTLVNFVGAHLQLKNTLESAKADIRFNRRLGLLVHASPFGAPWPGLSLLSRKAHATGVGESVMVLVLGR
jgi:PRTRC genetic system protein E